MFIAALCLLAFAGNSNLPPVSAATDYAHLNRAMVAPRLVHSVDPTYTSEARAAQIEGTVVLQAVIGVTGNVTHASVLSPLPAGLDRQALAAVKDWRYEPATMDFVTIPVLTTIDVLFRLPYQSNRPPAGSPKGLPPADLQQAYALGMRSESERNFAEARRYFRLCAAFANPVCQYRLGNLLVSGPGVNPNDFSQGVAWLELAKGHGNPQAAALHATAAAKLSSIQIDWVADIKPHLEHKRR